MTAFVCFIFGAAIVGFIWLISWLNAKDYTYDTWSNGVYYSTKKASRVCGRFGNRVSDAEGIHWHLWIESLWWVHQKKTYSYYQNQKPFFILTIDELRKPIIVPVTIEEAKTFIRSYSGEDSDRLIKEWCRDG